MNGPAPFAGSKVLITGGLGFIGSNLAHALVGLGADVTVIDSMIPEYGGNEFNVRGLGGRFRINVSDVRDAQSMKYLVRGQDYLFNLAGQTSHMDSMQDPYVDLDINARAQLSILESCRYHNPGIRIVFASTRQVYGKPDYLPVDENHPIRPVDINGINKMAGESYHLLYKHVYDMRACALRLTNTYGPRMRVKDARQTFLGIWIRMLVEGKPFEVWGGEQLRDFTYVDDVIDAMLRSASNDAAIGKIYNLGGERVVSLAQLADLLVAVNGAGTYRIREFPADRKRIDIGDYYANDQLIRTELGWAPHVDLEKGLGETLRYYRDRLQEYV